MSTATLKLLPHPQGEEPNRRSHLECRMTHTNGIFSLDYRYRYDPKLGALEFVDHRPGHFHGTLWQKTCFEFFIRDANTGRYWEWNFVPSKAWGAFAFESERQRCPVSDALLEAFPQWVQSDSKIESPSSESLELCVEIDLRFSSLLRWLLSPPSKSSLQIAISAVVSHARLPIQYWALHHGDSQKANFHDARSFVNFIF